MTVEYFTPSKEDIEQAPEQLKMLRLYAIHNDEGHFIGYDFESLYTQEEKAVISEFLLCPHPISPTFNSKFGIAKDDPKDFTPKSVVLKLSDQVPGYKYRETKVINGQAVTFYSQELPKDKS